MRVLVFLLVIILAMGLLHGYVGWRLIQRSPWGPTGRKRAWAGVVLIAIFQPSNFALRGLFGGNAASDAVAWLAYVILGFTVLCFLLLLARDLLWWSTLAANRVVGRARPASAFLPENPSRRQTLLHGLNLGVVGASAVGTVYGYWEAQRLAQVVEVDVPIDGLPPELDGFSIAQISDIHIGPTIKGGFLQAVVEKVNELNADLVAVTGDLVDGSVAYLGPDVAPLGGLKGKHGAFFITGNHEYFSGAEEWVEEVRRLGLDVLLNEHRVLEHAGHQVLLAGVTDLRAESRLPSHATDPEGSVKGAPSTAVRILLAHQPGSLEGALKVKVGPEQKCFDLMLSGHTHGGQFVPWNLFVSLAHPLNAGLGSFKAAAGKLWLYVNRGTGYWGPPQRLGVPSEITHLKLRRA